MALAANEQQYETCEIKHRAWLEAQKIKPFFSVGDWMLKLKWIVKWVYQF